MSLAKAALDIGAIKLRPNDPFTWASGYRMPIYNDNRMFLGYPEHVKTICKDFQGLLYEKDLMSRDIIIAGTSTAGIPHASFLSYSLSLPMIYVRDKPKGHGLQNQIEGIDAEKDLEGRTVVLIEDLISTGGSSVRAVEAIMTANGECNYCFAIFDYGLDKADKTFDALDPKCDKTSLITYDDLIKEVEKQGYFNQEEIDLLKEWREDPFGWGANNGFPKVNK